MVDYALKYAKMIPAERLYNGRMQIHTLKKFGQGKININTLGGNPGGFLV